jgi:hypothetical protein
VPEGSFGGFGAAGGGGPDAFATGSSYLRMPTWQASHFNLSA